MDLTQMQYFVLVAENGSTAKAAAEAMVSQSTVSKSILRLERELEHLLDWKNLLLHKGYGAPAEEFQEVMAWLRENGDPLKPYICNTGDFLEEALAHISEYEWLAFTSPAGVAALMGHLDRAGRGDYAQALADWSAPARRSSPCPLAFGETGVRSRVRRVLR